MSVSARADDHRELAASLLRIAREGVWACVSRVVVLDECASTQDEARARCEGAPGLLVVAARQLSGRGRMGRSWSDTHGLGVAATFVVDAGPGAPMLSLAAGLAACRAAELALPAPTPHQSQGPRVRLRWPNDVIVRAPEDAALRKLAGVLIEADSRLAFVGVGMNVLQVEHDFPEQIRSRCASLRMLGSDWTRTRVIDAIATLLSACLARPAHALAQEWNSRDCLVGTRRTFVHNGVRYSGVVESIDPLARITLRLDGSSPEQPALHLPALTTSLVHDDESP